MRFYAQQHQYYCGIDLHTKTMYICIMDQCGEIVLHQSSPVSAYCLLQLISAFLPDMVIAVQCIFAWYWLADFCKKHHIAFVLGHALYMKAIHGGKTKNDRMDSHKIAVLLRGGMLPVAYVYSAKMRSTRDLLRRRMHFMYKGSELLPYIQNTNSQYNLPGFEKSIARKRNRHGVAEHFPDQSVRKSIELDLEVLKHYDTVLNDVELFLSRHAKEHRPNDLYLLQTIPGVGKILALVMLYEIEDISRFERVQRFTSYARLVRPQKQSAGKLKGAGSDKMGNAYLKWAFSEASLLLIREKQQIKDYHRLLAESHTFEWDSQGFVSISEIVPMNREDNSNIPLPGTSMFPPAGMQGSRCNNNCKP